MAKRGPNKSSGGQQNNGGGNSVALSAEEHRSKKKEVQARRRRHGGSLGNTSNHFRLDEWDAAQRAERERVLAFRREQFRAQADKAREYRRFAQLVPNSRVRLMCEAVFQLFPGAIPRGDKSKTQVAFETALSHVPAEARQDYAGDIELARIIASQALRWAYDNVEATEPESLVSSPGEHLRT